MATTLPPVIAFVVQSTFWSLLSPLAWFLFYPAVFLSSWLGGRASGISATVISTALVTWFFLPPERTLALEPRHLPSVGVFLTMGFAFALFHERLRRATREARAALATSARVNEQLTQAAHDRQMFMSLIENSSDFIGIADPAGKPVYLNPAGRRMIGLGPGFPVEQVQIQDCYPKELRPFVTEVILKAMIERGRWSGETFFRHWQTEEAIPVSDEHFLIRDASGAQVLGIGTVTRDISEARRASDQLRDSEERFRLTIDEAPIGMALVALDGRFIRVNRVLCDIVGYSPEELTTLTFSDITHPDDLAADVALAARLARGEIPRYQLGKRYLRKDGTSVDIMLSVSLLRDRAGAPLYYIAQVEDITERKRAEAALQKSEQEFRSLAESMPQIVWATGPDGLNIYFNQQWVTYTGLTLEESYGEGWIIPFHPDDRQRCVGCLAACDAIPRHLRARVPPAARRWRLPVVVGQRRAAAGRERGDRQMVRHLHRHRADQGRGTETQGVRSEVLRDRFDLRRRDHLHRRRAANHDLQRRSGEDLWLLQGRGRRSFARHAHSRAGFARPIVSTSRALRPATSRPVAWESAAPRSPVGARTAKSSRPRPRSRSWRSATRPILTVASARHHRTQAHREGAAASGRSGSRAGRVARLRADAGDRRPAGRS